MKTKSKQLKKPLFFLFLFIVMSCAETGRAVEPMYGEVIMGLMVKLSSKLKKGRRF